MFVVVLALLAGQTPDAGPPAAPVAAPDAGPAIAGADDSDTWARAAQIVGVAEAALRSCAQPSDCVAVRHFSRCCAHVVIRRDQAPAVLRKRGALAQLMPAEQTKLCSIASCSGAVPAATCANSRCVLDVERPLWTRVGALVGASPDALRACTVASDCALIAHPTRCCASAAVTSSFAPSAATTREKLMAKKDAEGCAIKKCGSRGEVPVCAEGLCAVGMSFAP